MNLPIIFVCENNLFSSHLRIDHRQPALNPSRFAKSHEIDSVILDGNNISELYNYMIDSYNNIRKNPRPVFIEAMTYRWKGHVGHREDEDVGVKRSQDLKKWKDRDPIKLLKNEMLKNNIISDEEYNKLVQEIDKKIKDDWNKALTSPYPNKNNLLNFVYS